MQARPNRAANVKAKEGVWSHLADQITPYLLPYYPHRSSERSLPTPDPLFHGGMGRHNFPGGPPPFRLFRQTSRNTFDTIVAGLIYAGGFASLPSRKPVVHRPQRWIRRAPYLLAVSQCRSR